jgi:hypothetical protein
MATQPITAEPDRRKHWELTEEEQLERWLKAGQRALERMVEAAMTLAYSFDGCISFDGPQCSVIGSQPYMTLWSDGVREQGDGENAAYFGNPQAAVDSYIGDLSPLLCGHLDDQLAWRLRPKLEHKEDAGFRVFSRLAFLSMRGAA